MSCPTLEFVIYKLNKLKKVFKKKLLPGSNHCDQGNYCAKTDDDD
jgi:hypothetical protein